MGAPLRLAYNQDGSVKFSKAGKPVISVAKDISDNVKLVRENFVAGLQSYSNKVASEHGEAYTAMVKACLEAGKPILDNDKVKLNEAMQKKIDEALAEAEAKANAEAEAKANIERSQYRKRISTRLIRYHGNLNQYQSVNQDTAYETLHSFRRKGDCMTKVKFPKWSTKARQDYLVKLWSIYGNNAC